MNYSEKLKSPKWQKKRLEVLNRDEFKCCSCGDEETELHVHHLKYTKEPFDAPLCDLQTLCKHCHYYYTFIHNDVIKIYSLFVFDFVKIHKFNNVLISEFKNVFFIYYINDYGKLDLAIPFGKGSKIIDKLYELSKKK